MRTAETRAALTPYGIDFVDEDDAWCCFLRFRKQITDARCAHADEHLDEFGAADMKEWNTRFARHSARKQRFAGSRRSHEENAFWDFCSKGNEFFRVF